MLSNDVKLLAVFDNLEKKLAKVAATVGKTGPQGPQGPQGPAGKDGKDGKQGEAGKEGKAGKDGISVTSITVDFDNHLVVDLSDGTSVDAGEIRVEATENQYSVSMGGQITTPIPSIATITGSYTTLSDPLEEVIKCTGISAQVITLHPSPRQGQRKTVKRLGTGTVTITGGTIDGDATTELGVEVSVQLIYIDDSWIII